SGWRGPPGRPVADRAAVPSKRRQVLDADLVLVAVFVLDGGGISVQGRDLPLDQIIVIVGELNARTFLELGRGLLRALLGGLLLLFLIIVFLIRLGIIILVVRVFLVLVLIILDLALLLLGRLFFLSIIGLLFGVLLLALGRTITGDLRTLFAFVGLIHYDDGRFLPDHLLGVVRRLDIILLRIDAESFETGLQLPEGIRDQGEVIEERNARELPLCDLPFRGDHRIACTGLLDLGRSYLGHVVAVRALPTSGLNARKIDGSAALGTACLLLHCHLLAPYFHFAGKRFALLDLEDLLKGRVNDHPGNGPRRNRSANFGRVVCVRTDSHAILNLVNFRLFVMILPDKRIAYYRDRPVSERGYRLHQVRSYSRGYAVVILLLRF